MVVGVVLRVRGCRVVYERGCIPRRARGAEYPRARYVGEIRDVGVWIYVDAANGVVGVGAFIEFGFVCGEIRVHG